MVYCDIKERGFSSASRETLGESIKLWKISYITAETETIHWKGTGKNNILTAKTAPNMFGQKKLTERNI